MRLRRKAAGVALAIACGTVASVVGVSAPASATDVYDPPGWLHIQGWGDKKCLYDPYNGTLDVLEVYSCRNSPNQQWTHDAAANNEGFLLRNNRTGLCAQAGPHVQNSTAIIMVPCNASDPTQVWSIQTNLEHWINLASGYCMDRPEQTSYDGEHMQVWQCDGAPGDWGDQHQEQVAIWTSHPQ